MRDVISKADGFLSRIDRRMLWLTNALLGLIVLAFVTCIWNLKCNDWTYEQRMAAASILIRETDFKALVADFRAVSHGDHKYRLVTMRDPWAIYPERVRDIVRKRSKA